MTAILPSTSIREFQAFVNDVYGIPNERHFELGEMLNNVQRFAARGIKGIRKKDKEKTKTNLIISLSFFVSVLNRLKIDLEKEVWNRFPYVCSYCNSCPCVCRETKPDKREKISVDNSKKPESISGFQKMFLRTYPPETRTIEHAGIHLAEESGEFAEALWAYRSSRSEEDFTEICFEAADYFSCLIGVFNSLEIDLAEELSKFYPNNCHACNNSPCSCSYEVIKRFKS